MIIGVGCTPVRGDFMVCYLMVDDYVMPHKATLALPLYPGLHRMPEDNTIPVNGYFTGGMRCKVPAGHPVSADTETVGPFVSFVVMIFKTYSLSRL